MYILTSRDTLEQILDRHLGGQLPEAAQRALADDLSTATTLAWQELPEGIHPEVGANLGFAVCRETCWLGRALDAGDRFMVFRARGEVDGEPLPVGPGTADVAASSAS